MRFGKRFLCAFCALLMILCVSVPGFAGSARAKALIERLVVSRAAYGTRDNAALSKLASIDLELGEKWARIMDLWETRVRVNTVLPDGLPEDDTLCLVVLGYQLNRDGSMREELVQRLKTAQAAARKYPNAVIVCTGGGTAANNSSVTEAGQMAQWLYEHSIDRKRVLVEDRSRTTAQNAMKTFDLLEARAPQVRYLAIISSAYHIAGGVLLFGAEAILRDHPAVVVSNAAWRAPSGSLSMMFQAGALMELAGDPGTASDIYNNRYNLRDLPPLNGV